MEPVNLYHEGIVSLPIYSTGTVYKGASLYWSTEGSATSTSALIITAATGADMFATALKTMTTCTTNVSTPIVYQMPTQLIDVCRVWRVYWSLSTSDDLAVTSSTSSIITHGTGDDNLDGSWVYVNAGTGAGQLRFISGANTTTKTVADAFTTTPDSTSAIVIIRHQGRPTDGISLDTNRRFFVTVANESSSTNAIILKNYIDGPVGRRELDPTQEPLLRTMDGLNNRGVRFYSDVIWADTAVHAQGIS